VRAHLDTLEEAREYGECISLRVIAHNITCPIFIVAGALDRILIYDTAERLAKEVSEPSELLVVEDGNHVCHNRPYKYRPQTDDWMAEQLGAGSPP